MDDFSQKESAIVSCLAHAIIPRAHLRSILCIIEPKKSKTNDLLRASADPDLARFASLKTTFLMCDTKVCLILETVLANLLRPECNFLANRRSAVSWPSKARCSVLALVVLMTINPSSCECDHASVLRSDKIRLDHWLMSNTSFAPPLSSLDPAQTLYATNGDFQSIPVDPYPQPGAMWLDPNLPPGSIPNPGLGMTLLPTQPMEYMPPGGPEFIQAPNGMVAPGVGGQWGDGNSMQYWNTLVDRE